MFLFISTSPFMKFHSRRFHVSSTNFLRKVILNHTSSSANNASLSSINIPSHDLNSNTDYLGIESDEGAITINPQKHSHLQQNQVPLKVRETFYRAAFGVIRYDKDNSLKHHGQYGRKFDFTFPHSTRNHAQVYKQTNDHVVDGQTLKNDDEFEKKSNISYNDDYYFQHSTMDNLIHNETQHVSEEQNFIDETSHKQEIPQASSKLLLSAINEQFTSKTSNFTEKDYFETLGSSADQSVEQGSTAKYAVEIEHNKKHPISEELNCIENSYFGTFSNMEHSALKNGSSGNDLPEEDHCIFSSDNKVDATTNEISSFKKSYFEDCTFSENNVSIDEHFSENISVNKIPSVYNNTNISKITEEHQKTENNSNDFSYIESNFFNQTTNSDLENSEKSFKNVLCNQLNKKIHENHIKNYARSDSKYISNFKQIKKNFKNLRPSTEILKSNENSQIYAESCINENTNISNELHIKTENSFLKKNNLKYSKPPPEEQDKNDQITTAHDFVTKLRKQQIQNTNKGKVAGNQEVDSKGFRILKHEIQDLSYCTHDEILHILKKNIVYSDENLLVLNKPYSLVIHESQTTKSPCLSTFLNDLAKEMGEESKSSNLFTVHRLDKETTGCILLARNEAMATNLKSLFAERKIIKKYWIITRGVPDPEEGVIDIPISEGSIDNRKRMVLHPKLPKDIIYRNHSKNGKPAVTSYKVLSESGNAALVEAIPVTGIKHQIRVHFGFGLDCPILGDHKYSHLDKLVPQKLPTDMLQRLHVRQSKVRHIPMHIHAKCVVIPNYFDGRDLFVNIPLPDHMKDSLKRLKFRKKDMKR